MGQQCAGASLRHCFRRLVRKHSQIRMCGVTQHDDRKKLLLLPGFLRLFPARLASCSGTSPSINRRALRMSHVLLSSLDLWRNKSLLRDRLGCKPFSVALHRR